MKMRILSAADVLAAVDMRGAIDAMREAFVALSRGEAVVPLRLALETPGGTALFMPGHLPGLGATAAKIVTVHPGNTARGLPVIHAAVLVLDPDTGRALALMDGTRLTALRTGAAGGLAADLLALREASVVALFGSGVQARTQLEAVRCVRPVREVRIVSNDQDSAHALAAEQEGIRVSVVRDRAAALRGAHVVVTATDSRTPVFDGTLVEPGTHVTGVGSYTPAMREVDTALVRRARVFVDQREAALAEAGDLAGPIAEGEVGAGVIVGEIGEVAAGLRPGRTADDQITFFKSVGNAVQDVAIAARVLAAAEREGRGLLVDL
jgi:ornithine cyclodeaminase/alanine dehydrogenase-like protein (mu-crystallin family)